MGKQQRNNGEEDQALWLLVQRGDKSAFASLFSKYYSPLYAYSCCYVSTEDAEEAVQDLMVWLWEKREQFSISGDLRHYLFMAMKNKCLSIMVRQRKDVVGDGFIFNELNTFYEHFDYCVVKELEEKIEKAIANLPDGCRVVFEMNRFQNKTRQEISDDLGVSMKTVDYRMQQALKMLRVELKEYLPLFFLLCQPF